MRAKVAELRGQLLTYTKLTYGLEIQYHVGSVMDLENRILVNYYAVYIGLKQHQLIILRVAGLINVYRNWVYTILIIGYPS